MHMRAAHTVVMASVVAEVMGSDFARLHPKVQWRFGLQSSDHRAQFGVGVMEEMTHSRLVPPPLLWAGRKRGLFPAGVGKDVPFTIANYAYVDELGRETMSFVRRFAFAARPQGMNSVMVSSAESDAYALDYLGFSSDMVVHTRCAVDSDGGLVLESEVPRFLLGPIAPKLPKVASAVTIGREWWDAAEERHRIEIEVKSPVLGQLFLYRGWFTAEERECRPADIPSDARPRSIESRE
jgi:hypothetical protein